MAEPTHLVIGHLAKPHGIKGELYVEPLTEAPERVFAAGREVLLGTAAGELGDPPGALSIASSRPFKRGFLVRFDGVADRNAAEALARRYLFLAVEELEPLGDEELFYHQLLGAEVVTVAGASVGRVREVYDTEPADLLEVEGEDGRRRLIPFSRQVVREVDREAGRVVIDPPDGLLEI